MPNCKPYDRTSRYEGESGHTLSFYQIAMRSVKGTSEVIQTEDGFVINGELYRRVSGDGVDP